MEVEKFFSTSTNTPAKTIVLLDEDTQRLRALRWKQKPRFQ
ncbi:hypothetical protein [Comamonas sp. GB3 AK4-5]